MPDVDQGQVLTQADLTSGWREAEAERLADAREQEAERAFHAAARALAAATFAPPRDGGSSSDEAMSWWLHGGEWDA